MVGSLEQNCEVESVDCSWPDFLLLGKWEKDFCWFAPVRSHWVFDRGAWWSFGNVDVELVRQASGGGTRRLAGGGGSQLLYLVSNSF